MRNVAANSLCLLGAFSLLFGCKDDSSVILRDTSLQTIGSLQFEDGQLDFWKNGKLPSVAEAVREKQSSLLMVRKYSPGNWIYVDDESYWKLSIGVALESSDQSGAMKIANAILAKGASAFPRNMCFGIVTDGTLKISESSAQSVTYEISIKSEDMRMVSNTAECHPEDIELSGVARSTELDSLSEWQRNIVPDGTTLKQTYP